MAMIGVIAGLMLFGIVFAVLEYARPLYPTWMAVVIGTAVTLGGITVCLHIALDTSTAWTAAGIAWAGFFLTGVPMAVLQAIKEQSFADEAQRRTGNTGKLDGNEKKTNTPAP